MIVAHPDRLDFIDRWDQYYGPDLLVRPVWEPGIGHVIPVFVRAGGSSKSGRSPTDGRTLGAPSPPARISRF